MLNISKYQTIKKDKYPSLLDKKIIGGEGDLLYYTEDNAIGLIYLKTKTGIPSLLTQPIYNEIRTFSNGRAIFRRGYTYGLLNEEGVEVFKSHYDHLDEISPNHYLIGESGPEGIIDSNGKTIIKSIYEHICLTKDNYYECWYRNNTIDLRDINGKYIGNYEEYKFYHDYIIFKHILGFGVDLKGHRIISPEYKKIDISSKDVCFGFKNTKIDIYDLKTGEQKSISKMGYTYIDDGIFKKGNKLFDYSNYEEKIINLPDKTEKITIFNHNRFLIGKKDLNFLLIDSNGQIIKHFPMIIHNCTKLDNYIIFQYDGGLYGVMDSNGSILIYLAHMITHINKDTFLLKNESNYQLINLSNDQITKKYDDINKINDYLYQYKINKNGSKYYGFVNNEADIIGSLYSYIYSFQNGIAPVKQDSKQGYVNDRGETIVEPYEHDISAIHHVKNFIMEQMDSLYNIYDLKGKIILKNIKCQRVMDINDHQLLIDDSLVNIDNIDLNYHLNIEYQNNCVERVFDSEEIREEVIEYLNQDIIKSMEKIKKKVM